jgi:hypothetical protein
LRGCLGVDDQVSDRNQILIDRLERLDELRNDPVKMNAIICHYKDGNYADFISDWFLTYDPRKSPSELPFILFERQKEYINWLYKRWKQKEDGLVEKSRDMGLTWLCCAFAVCVWLFEEGQTIAFGSRKEDLVDKIGDPDCIFEKMRIILRSIPKDFIPPGFEEKKHATYLKIINPVNGTIIKGEAGDNIGRGGRSSIYFKDESAFYERPDKIEAALSMNSDVKIDVSTPNGAGGPFYRKRHSGNFPIFTFHWKDDPRKDQGWYDLQKQLLDPVILAQEVDIDYTASISNNLINGALVQDAINQEIVFEIFGPKVLGVDPARFGDDRTAYVMRQGRVVHWIDTARKLKTVEIIGQVSYWMRHYWFDAVFVDVIGLGAGVYDGLAEEWGERIIPVSSSEKADDHIKYFNKRCEMWCDMRAWLIDGPVVLPNHPDLMVDLSSVQYTFNSNGQRVLEKKEDMKKRGIKSPDIGDALAMTFAESVDYYTAANDENYVITKRTHGAGGY